MKSLHSFLVSLAACLLIVTSGSSASDIEYLGFRLPQPEEIPKLESRQPIVMYQHLRDIRLIVSIDKAGGVSSVAPENDSDSGFSSYMEDYLKSWRWKSAEFEGRKVESKIMISALFTAGYSRPFITYPGDSLTFDASSDLRFESFKRNGIEPPRIIEFPSVSLHVDKSDTSNFCAFAVLHLELDSTGRVLSSQVINSNSPQHLPKLESAMLWTKFAPAKVSGQAVGSSINVALTFNRNLNYPTVVWRSCCLDELNLVQRESVRLLLDSSGYVIPPIPQLPPGDSLNLGRSYRMSSDQLFCRVEIKPSGKSNWHILSRASRQDVRIVQAVRKNIRFFPAIDTGGSPADFEGYAIIHRLNSRTVRIEYSWLNEGRLSTPADKIKKPKEIR